LRGKVLMRLEMRDNKVVGEEPLLANLDARIRVVRMGPDGALYVLTDSGGASISASTPATSRLLRLAPN
jgi:glucose/arabinose dehydrogenase